MNIKRINDVSSQRLSAASKRAKELGRNSQANRFARAAGKALERELKSYSLDDKKDIEEMIAHGATDEEILNADKDNDGVVTTEDLDKEVKDDVWYVKYHTEDEDLATVWFYAKNAQDAVDQALDEYWDIYEIVSVYDENGKTGEWRAPKKSKKKQEGKDIVIDNNRFVVFSNESYDVDIIFDYEKDKAVAFMFGLPFSKGEKSIDEYVKKYLLDGYSNAYIKDESYFDYIPFYHEDKYSDNGINYSMADFTNEKNNDILYAIRCGENGLLAGCRLNKEYTNEEMKSKVEAMEKELGVVSPLSLYGLTNKIIGVFEKRGYSVDVIEERQTFLLYFITMDDISFDVYTKLLDDGNIRFDFSVNEDEEYSLIVDKNLNFIESLPIADNDFTQEEIEALDEIVIAFGGTNIFTADAGN